MEAAAGRGPAHTGRMLLADALEFARNHDRTVLATRREDGGLQMSPVNSGVLDGTIVISSTAGRAKVHNLRRDPTASVLIFTERFYGAWVQIDGRAELIDQRDPAALDLLVQTYRTIAGEHPDWADYRAAMVRDDRLVIRIHPERASGALH